MAQVGLPAETPAVATEQRTMEALRPELAPSSEEPAATTAPFGAHLFKGGFEPVSFTGFNPEYRISVGDKIHITLWGAAGTNIVVEVDAQGKIFIPEVGPVAVLGVRNADLTEAVSARVRQVYVKGVNLYANLVSAQPVRVYVTGFVKRPGLYAGSSSDIMMHYLSKAGGIDPDRGSYVDVQLVRDQKTVEVINLYDFISGGKTHQNQFRDGDTLVVKPRHSVVQLNGEVLNAYRFEIASDETPLTELLELARPLDQATHVSILRNASGISGAEVYPLDEIARVKVHPDDVVTLVRRSRPESILISVIGEHDGVTRMVLPYGATLGDALARITLAPRGETEHVQLFRKSVAARQKALLDQALDNLARNVTSTPSDSLEEAQLRQLETQTILAFIERAREVQPQGQVLLGPRPESDRIHLENGDIIHIPALSNIINISGEVRFPNTQSYQRKFKVKDYVRAAGGFTPTADTDNIIVLKVDGATVNLDLIGKSARSYRPDPGDEIIILPEPDTKRLQFAKDITGILYQIAIGARVVLDP